MAESFNDGDEVESDFVDGQRVLFVRARSDGRDFPVPRDPRNPQPGGIDSAIEQDLNSGRGAEPDIASGRART